MRHDFQTLKAFIAVAEGGSIAAAAERERTVASAVSRRIAELEEVCGTPLLYRHRRGVSLTAAGAELLTYARRVIADLERLDHSMGEFATGVRGQVRLLANTSSIVQFLATDIARFLERHPTVKIDLEERTSEQIQRLLLEGMADVGILVASQPVDRLVMQPYQVDQLMVMMPEGHPLARKKSIRFKDTLKFDHVGLPRGSSLCEMLLAHSRQSKRPLKLRIQTTSFDGVRKMVSSGLGIGVLPRGSVVPYLQVEGLVAVPLDEPWATRTLTVATRERHLMTRVGRLLAEHLATRHSAMPDRDA